MTDSNFKCNILFIFICNSIYGQTKNILLMFKNLKVGKLLQIRFYKRQLAIWVVEPNSLTFSFYNILEKNGFPRNDGFNTFVS